MEEEGEESSQKKSQTDPPAPAASLLTDDLIVEILSRLPASSVHRAKCVSRSWRDLIADSAHRSKLPQTLAGFFYHTYQEDDRGLRAACRFAAVSSGAPAFDPSLPFLPPRFSDVDLLDTCAGLLVCRCYHKTTPSPADEPSYVYVVCNPATERWVELPLYPNSQPPWIVRLAFDPAVSRHFHIFEFEKRASVLYIGAVNIYSSQTGSWNRRESGWDENVSLSFERRSVFFNGMLHLVAHRSVVVVDTEGEAWKIIPVPRNRSYGSIGLSRGRLFYMNTNLASMNKTSVWCLEDYDSKEWVLKHSFCTSEVSVRGSWVYTVTAIHPDCDAIFLHPWHDDALASYDMGREEFRHVINLEEGSRHGSYMPYVPLFSESLAGADGH